ncbi:Receptor-like protein 43 [Bienertia sinuspersici]
MKFEKLIENLTCLTVLDLDFVDISDVVPVSLSNLTSLTSLSLMDCNLYGDFPIDVFRLPNLEEVRIGFNNDLKGYLPEFPSNSPLKTIYLYSTAFSRELTPSIGKLTNLIELNLVNTNLRGLIPFSIGNLTNLTSLELDCNFKGELPLSITNLTQLTKLSLSNVYVKPPILNSWLLKLNKLELLALTNMNISSGFPSAIINLTRLELLHLPSNQLTVFLPWDHLKVLHIQDNKFQGQLPSPPTSMKVYQVSQYQLSGVIPKQICNGSSLVYLDLSSNNLRALEVLDVGNNRLNDTFPSWLGSLPKLQLQVLVLRHNNFYGKVTSPKSDRCFFTCLRIIDLSHNFHVGNLPNRYFRHWLAMRVTNEDHVEYSSSSKIVTYIPFSSVTYYNSESYLFQITITNKGSETLIPKILNVLRVIDFSSNNFTSGIPKVIGSLRGLQALNLSNNHLMGGIPLSLANIIDLEALDLSQNMLSGKIPQQLTKLIFLAIFNVSQNHLRGHIPQGEQFNTFDGSSFDGNLALCGAPLSNKCGKTYSIPPLSMTGDQTKEEDDSKMIDWIIRLLGCLTGCIVGFVIGKIYITDRYHDWFMETFGRKSRPKPKPKSRARRSMPSHRRN